MPVFKTFFRIIKATRGSLIIYFMVFLGISFLISQFNKSPVNTDFTETKINIAVINRDGNTAITKGFAEFLARKNKIVDIPDDRQRLQDALFFRDVEYIAIIPKGFSEDFKNGGKMAIESATVPGSVSAIYAGMQADRYFQTLRLTNDFSGLSAEDQAKIVSDSMAASVDVKMTSKATVTQLASGYCYYYNYLAYAVLAICILGISTIMMVFNQPDLRRRNLCSPIGQRRISCQLALGSAAFTTGCWVLFVIFSLLIHGKALVSSGLLPAFALNAYVFTIICTALGFLVGILIRNNNAQAAIANVVSLGMSFICGVFVPQVLLGKSVLRFASFLPAYWYVRANDAIGAGKLSSDPGDIFIPILIQIGFAAAIFSAALFISKQKQMVNQ